MGYEQPIVRPPAEYKGDFFKGEPSPSEVKLQMLMLASSRTELLSVCHLLKSSEAGQYYYEIPRGGQGVVMGIS